MFALLCLHVAAFAQSDDRARELLAGITPVTTTDFHTLQQTTTMTMNDGLTIRTQLIVDYDNRRAIVHTDFGSNQENGTKLLILFQHEGVGGGWNTLDGAKLHMYELDGDTVTLYATMEFGPAVVDEPLDESLFD